MPLGTPCGSGQVSSCDGLVLWWLYFLMVWSYLLIVMFGYCLLVKLWMAVAYMVPTLPLWMAQEKLPLTLMLAEDGMVS
jgi:hypothetical protein